MIIYKICLYHKWNEYKKAQAFPDVVPYHKRYIIKQKLFQIWNQTMNAIAITEEQRQN